MYKRCTISIYLVTEKRMRAGNELTDQRISKIPITQATTREKNDILLLLSILYLFFGMEWRAYFILAWCTHVALIPFSKPSIKLVLLMRWEGAVIPLYVAVCITSSFYSELKDSQHNFGDWIRFLLNFVLPHSFQWRDGKKQNIYEKIRYSVSI